MKNRVAIITTAIALVALMIVGATLAWFTDTDTVTNAVTLGNLDIEVWEYSDKEDEKLIDEEKGLVFGDEVPVVPGDEYVKAPFVRNAGSVDSYIRAQIVFSRKPLLTTAISKNYDDFKASVLAQIDEEEWVLIDGYYYYTGILAPGADTPTLFNEIVFPGSWGNEMADFSFTIDIVADGIQVKNLPIDDFANLLPAARAAEIAKIFVAEYK